ncbi:MAG: hypothetical protein AAGC68_16440, partial [Verrucomicrobiota bacterium]
MKRKQKMIIPALYRVVARRAGDSKSDHGFAGIFFLLFAILPTLSGQDLPDYEIAIIHEGESWYFDRASDAFLSELRPLAQDRYNFTTTKLDANTGGLADTFQAAFDDPDINLIYAAGLAASAYAANLPEVQRTKPVVAAALFFGDRSDGLISPEGTSTARNLTFISEPTRIAA